MIWIRNVRLLNPIRCEDIKHTDILIEKGRIKDIGRFTGIQAKKVIDGSNLVAAPSLIDAHTHVREPGFSYKETAHHVAKCAVRGGFTCVMAMANTHPVIDSVEELQKVQEIYQKEAIPIKQLSAIGKNLKSQELVDFDAMKQAGCIGFSNDGLPISLEAFMQEALKEARRTDSILSLHEENPSFVFQPGIHDGLVAASLGLKGAMEEAEISLIERDLRLACETKGKILIQHISSARSLPLIQKAKEEFSGIYTEISPHHFSLTEEDILRYGTLAKVNPPLRTEENRIRLIEGLQNGIIDLIATDHAPHADFEKSKDFKSAPSGMIGLETAFALSISILHRQHHFSLQEIIEKMSINPAKIYGLEKKDLSRNKIADLFLFDPTARFVYEHTNSKSNNSPFLGQTLYGKVMFTISRGVLVYDGSLC